MLKNEGNQGWLLNESWSVKGFYSVVIMYSGSGA